MNKKENVQNIREIWESNQKVQQKNMKEVNHPKAFGNLYFIFFKFKITNLISFLIF